MHCDEHPRQSSTTVEDTPSARIHSLIFPKLVGWATRLDVSSNVTTVSRSNSGARESLADNETLRAICRNAGGRASVPVGGHVAFIDQLLVFLLLFNVKGK